MAKEFKLTAARVKELEEELNYLKTTRMQEEIEDILAHAVIIEDENEASGHIGLGCTVQIQDLSSGELLEFRITGSQEANPMMGKMSDDSPFGRALVGHGPGEVVTVEAPAGRFEAKILSVTR